MIHIPYDRIKNLIVEKTGSPAEEIEQKIQDKMTEFSGLLSLEGSAHIIANELGVDISETKSEPLKINELKIGMQQIKSQVKVIQKYDVNTFDRNGKEGKVQSLFVGDETGRCRLTFWHDDTELVTDVVDGDIITLNNLVVRENNGRIEIHGTKKTEIGRNPEGIEIEVIEGGAQAAPTDAPYAKIGDLTKDSTQSVTLFGVIVQAMPPYFYPVDKTTNKRVRIDEPSMFDTEKHAWNYVCNIVLDDGTENMRIAAFREQVLDILGISEDELMAIKDKPESFSDIQHKKLGTYCKLIGRPSYNQQYERLEMVAQTIFTSVDPEEEIKRLGK